MKFQKFEAFGFCKKSLSKLDSRVFLCASFVSLLCLGSPVMVLVGNGQATGNPSVTGMAEAVGASMQKNCEKFNQPRSREVNID